MKEEMIVFKGTKEGLTIILNEDVSFDELKKHFENKVKSLKTFLTGSKITVRFTRKLEEEEITELVNILKSKGKAEVLMVLDDNDDLHSSMFESILEGSTKFFRGTLRSGQSINYNGNVVIVGDVNAGAEVVASGNIIVLGLLRGMVYAGASTNNNAFIAGLNLKPTQIRIGEIIANPSDVEEMKGAHPELISIKDTALIKEELRTEY